MRFWKRREHFLDDLEKDIQDHIELEVRDNIDRGMSEEQAHRVALSKFGNIAQIREETRAVWNMVWVEQLLQDLRYALRTLRHRPSFTLVVVATLALGIGMNTAVFSVLDAVLFRPLPYPNADRLFWLGNYNQQFKSDNFAWRTDFLIWKSQAKSFEKMTAYGNQDLSLVPAGEASQERIASFAGDFWSITGVQPVFGRLSRSGEPNALVLSWGLFERRFGGDPHVIGKTVTLNGWPFTITGVLPKEFRCLFPQQFWMGDETREMDAYIPIPDAMMAMLPAGTLHWEETTRHFGPAPFWILVVGQLRSGIPVSSARAEMQAIYSRVAKQYPSPLRQNRVLRFDSMQEKLSGNVRAPLTILLVAVGFVLLIACANIANLLLSRASARQREIAIRTAVGAGRDRVIRQVLAESLLTALLGCTAGLLLAACAIPLLPRLWAEAVPRLDEIALNGRVMAFTLGISVLAGLIFGFAPALTAWKTQVMEVLKAETGTSSSDAGRLRLREVLAASEVAFAIVLLTGAGLMLKSFWQMNKLPTGFAPEKILSLRVTPSGQRYSGWAPKQAYIEQLLQSLSSLPNVEAAGVAAGSMNTSVQLIGANPSDGMFASIRGVSSTYLRAMGVPLVRGAWPAAGSLFGVVVNETFERHIGGDAIGQRIRGSILNDTILGVVADFKTAQLDADPLPEVYVAYERMPLGNSMRVVVRTTVDAKGMSPSVRQVAAGVDRTQAVYELRTLEEALASSIAPRRFNLFLLVVFAATALILAVTGTYGVIAYSVSLRTREIGIRVALGADRSAIVGMVVRHAMSWALAGVAAGVLAALALTRTMTALLYNVRPNDPWVLGVASIGLAATAVLAALAPALKAARVDPLTALRYE